VLGIFLFLVGGVVLIWRGYGSWAESNHQDYEELTMDLSKSVQGSEAFESLDDKLERFAEDDVQRETLELSCEETNLFFREILEEHWEDFEVRRFGVVCTERSLDIYMQLKNKLWVKLIIWQRAEGKLDFVIRDVEVGPYSLGGLSWGYVTNEFNKGVKDALEFLDNSELLGRDIVEFYMEEDGLRMIGEK
jgi:hypothetical protein